MINEKKEYNMNYSYLIPSVFYGPEYELEDKHFIFDLIRKMFCITLHFSNQ
jgi:hypothetical protein